jgi:citrate lyase beta subunit
MQSLGFSSDACMEPKQVAVAHEIFVLDPLKIERAVYNPEGI